MRIDFYHLTALPLERVLPSICEKLLDNGERLLVVADDAVLAQLDESLWTYSAASFLPHGRENGEAQPILLSPEPVAANGARNVALADGRWRDEALGFDRIFYFFDSGRIDEARASWRALKSRETELHYWKQDERRRWVEGP
jgi:DNA polymerase III subunit chi